MFRGMMILEAINSVAIEHPAACGCDTCKAAAGDRDALVRVWAAVQDQLDASDA